MNDDVNMGWMADGQMDTLLSRANEEKLCWSDRDIKRRLGWASIQMEGISKEATDHTFIMPKGGWPTGPWDTMAFKNSAAEAKGKLFRDFSW